MSTTPRWSLPYPAGTDIPDGPSQIEALALALDGVAMDDQGLLSGRPVSTSGSPGKKGRYYYATDEGILYRDTGTSWTTVGFIADGSVTPAKLGPQVTNAQTGTTYTLVLGDLNEIVEIANSAAITLTVPPNSSVAFPVGATITVVQTGAGQITVAPGAGVTVNATPGLKMNGQWSVATLLKRATDTWLLFGNVTA